MIYLTFSKVDPSKNKIAANNLSDDVNETNMRKLKLNAQVTAMTSIIEAFGNIIQWSIWIFITKFAGYGTLIQSILLYFVILPYVFLMNTSQNKDRVIEIGWLNVLKNAFGNGVRFSAIGNWCRMKSISKVLRINSHSKNVVDSDVQNLPLEGGIRSPNDDNIIRISAIFRDQDINQTENSQTLTINVPVESTKTSKNFYQKRVIFDDQIADPATKIKYDKNKTASYLTWIKKRRDFLKQLLSNISNDDMYIEIINKFFRFEDSIRIGDSNFNFHCDETKKFNTGICLRQIRNDQIISDPLKLSPLTLQRRNGIKEVKPEIREKMIKRLLRYYKDNEDIYEHYLQLFLQSEAQNEIIRVT